MFLQYTTIRVTKTQKLFLSPCGVYKAQCYGVKGMKWGVRFSSPYGDIKYDWKMFQVKTYNYLFSSPYGEIWFSMTRM